MLLGMTKSFPAEKIALFDAIGRYCAEPLIAKHDSPRFDNSQVDGFALHESDLGATERVLWLGDPIHAGHQGEIQISQSGGAIPVMTGAPIPHGAAAVTMLEDVDRVASGITLQVPVLKGANIRAVGEEYRAGSTLLEAGSRISTGPLAIFASQGVAEVAVYGRPKVSIVTTGDELRQAGEDLEPNSIYDANGPGIRASLAEFGIQSSLRRAHDIKTVYVLE